VVFEVPGTRRSHPAPQEDLSQGLQSKALSGFPIPRHLPSLGDRLGHAQKEEKPQNLSPKLVWEPMLGSCILGGCCGFCQMKVLVGYWFC